MSKHILSLFLLTVLAILSVSLVAAQVTLSQPDALSDSKNNVTMVITNPTASSYDVTVTPSNIDDGKSHIITISSNPVTLTLAAGASSTVTLTRSAVPSAFILGDFSAPVQVSVVGDPAVNSTVQLHFINSFCSRGDIGTGLSITTLKDEKLDNEDEWKWYPLDNIEISVKVHNSADEDLDLTIEYGLYKASTQEFIDIDEDTIDLSVDEGKTEEATITFQVPSDIDEATDYRFYVKAYEDEDTRCVDIKDSSYFEEVEVKKESRSVVLSDIEMDSSALCGDTLELTAKVSNIGTSDEEKVLVNLYNKDLGVNMNKVLDDLDSGDEESISFSFQVPTTAVEKTYNFDLKTRYRYDDGNSGCDNDEDTACYEKNSLDDLDKTFTKSLKVEGNCVKPVTNNVQVTAALNSEAIAGQEIVVKANIKNLGTVETPFTVLVTGIDSFATLESIDSQSFTLAAGASKDVLINLKAKSDASGDYTFNIQTLYGGQTKTQPVSLTVQAASSSGLSSSAFFNSLKDNWLIGVIVLVNVVLIILIIVVAVRIMKK